ncbi:MAG TPA: response regulator [Phototrophicaceae bacterium]|nr:response regulator [Phototrophicaceae bacterium]
MPSKRLLVIEDDYDVAEMLVMYFTSYQYEVFHADSGMVGVEMARTKYPHLILLDVMMPDIDGYETCSRIRHMTLTKYIPVIFLTQRDERANKVKGLELGADDYVTKPFDVDELRLRVAGAIRRATRESLHETRTGLPTGLLVEEEIQRRRYSDQRYTSLQFGLDGYKAYCDVYGFLAGNEVFGFAARSIQQVVSECGTTGDFIGVREDHFIVLTDTEKAKTIETRIRDAFTEGVKTFYSFADVERGGLVLNAGTSEENVAPLMGLVAITATV